MKTVKQALAVLGTLVMIALIAAVVTPRATHALAAALVRDVDNPARATIVNAFCTSQADIFGNLLCSPAYVVPEGYRLAIDSVEVVCNTIAGQSIGDSGFYVSEGGSANFHIFSLIQEPELDPQFAQFTLNQQVHYYADPGSTLSFQAVTSNLTQEASCQAFAHGYLVSYP